MLICHMGFEFHVVIVIHIVVLCGVALCFMEMRQNVAQSHREPCSTVTEKATIWLTLSVSKVNYLNLDTHKLIN
jgi:hypothetical protein